MEKECLLITKFMLRGLPEGGLGADSNFNSQKMEGPLVSIVVPVYNGSNYLSNAIDSALAQTYPNIEVLVVNDGSDDNGQTRNIALSYGSKIRYFEKENGGVSTALNLGIQKMHGDYFCWLSHDDIYDPFNISLQLEYISSSRKDIVSACSTKSFQEKLPKLGKSNRFKKQSFLTSLTQPLDFWRVWIYACSLLIPIRILNKVNGLNEANITTQDVELIWELLRVSEIHVLSNTLAFRRVHSEQGFQNPNLVSLNCKEGSDLVKRKIRDFGVEYFLKKDSSEFKRALTFLHLAAIYSTDKRRRAIEGTHLTEWLIDESWKAFPVVYSPTWIIKRIPIEILYYCAQTIMYLRKGFFELKRRLLQ